MIQEPTRLQRLWLCEAIRQRETHAGPLDDREANRHAQRAAKDLPGRIQARALFLARRDGLVEALDSLLGGARLALLLLFLLAIFGGAGLAFASVGDGREPINVFWALLGLLGLHFVSLLLWLASQLFTPASPTALGRFWLWITRTFSQKLMHKTARDQRAPNLVPALFQLLERRRLVRWLGGSLVHGFWLVTLLACLVMLLGLFSTRRYGFIWETTLLPASSLIRATEWLGFLPALVGFPLPDASTVLASGTVPVITEAARQAWAGWLLGVLVVFGLLPRALLLLVCWLRWQLGQRKLTLADSISDYSLLAERLQPVSASTGIVDPAPAQLYMPHIANASGKATPESRNAAHLSSNVGHLEQQHTQMLVAIELNPERNWPPAELPAAVMDGGIIEDRNQRRQFLDRITLHPPQRLAIAIDSDRSPDRGTLGLITEIAPLVDAAYIWLLPPQVPPDGNQARLKIWRESLDALGMLYNDTPPWHWLETGRE
ncbi:Hypothetical protein HDN1F_28780 [gamma proteobacterium HdN1]|nr:Hypothetical protein HDN1F_28780 [gamma proteobacterium HdN1]